MTPATNSGGGGDSPVAAYVLAFIGALLAGFVGWIVHFSQPGEVEQVDAALAAAVARREAPVTAEITARASSSGIVMTVIGVPSPADQTRLLFAVARSQAAEEWQPVAVSFGSYVEPDPALGPTEVPFAEAADDPVFAPPREVHIDRVVHVIDGQVAIDR